MTNKQSHKFDYYGLEKAKLSKKLVFKCKLLNELMQFSFGIFLAISINNGFLKKAKFL